MEKFLIYIYKKIWIFILCLMLAAVPQVTFAESSATITLDAKNMDVVEVLNIIREKAGFNLSISPQTKGRITLFLKDIPASEALDVVLLSNNLAAEKNENVIYVMTGKEYQARYGKKYADERKVKIFNAKNAKVSRLKEVFAQMASGVGKIIADEPSGTIVVIDVPEKIAFMNSVFKEIDRPLKSENFELSYLTVEDAEKKITPMLTANAGSLKIDAASNRIIVNDYPETINKIRDTVKAFDVKPRQVLIDSKIIEIKPSKKFYSGINWDAWLNKYFRLQGNFAMPSSGGTDKVGFGTIGIAEPAGVKQYTNIMEFLETFGDARILSSPRILVLNNQEAKILVGTKDVYITSSTSAVGESAVTTQSVNFVDVGVKLHVTPTINKEGYITLKIKPEISSSQRETIKTDDRLTEIPIVTTSEAETTVMVKDGVSIIIGGLRKITRSKERKGVPFLSRIPILGLLFGSSKDEWSKNELVILITPNIVTGDKSIEEELNDKLKPASDGAMKEGDVLDIVAEEASKEL